MALLTPAVPKILVFPLLIAGTAVGASPFLSFTHAHFAAEPQKAQVTVQPDQSAWTADLHEHGLAPGKDTLHRLPEFARYGAVFFLDEKTLVATFVTRHEVSGLQRRDDPNRATPYKLHAILFNTLTGEITHKLEWGSMSPDVGIAARSDGNLLVISFDRVFVFSRDNDVIAEIALPSPSLDKATMQLYRISPTGNTVVLQYDVRGEKEFITVHTETRTSSVQKSEITPDSAVSDSGIVVTKLDKREGSSPEVWIRNFDQPFRLLCGALSGCGSSSFVNNETLLMYNRGELRLVNVNGDTVFHQNLTTFATFDSFDPRPIRSSANGQRFGVVVRDLGSTGETTPGSFEMDGVPDRLLVYDFATHHWVFALQNKKGLLKPDLNFALSPAGDFLALAIDGVLRVYTLPPAGPPTAAH